MHTFIETDFCGMYYYSLLDTSQAKVTCYPCILFRRLSIFFFSFYRCGRPQTNSISRIGHGSSNSSSSPPPSATT